MRLGDWDWDWDWDHILWQRRKGRHTSAYRMTQTREVTMEKIIEWDRKFQVWQYSVSHAKLLLRSFDPDQYGTRIDLLFLAVELLLLKPSFSNLSVMKASIPEADAFLTPRGIHRSPHGHLFVINDGEGCVQAATCLWHEDQGDHHTPSRFGPLRGTE